MRDPEAPGEREYLLGTGDSELVRLGFQHQVWAEPTARLWDRAGFGLGDTLLDVGCGPGYATFDLAQRVGDRGRVIAADISQRFLAQAGEQARVRGITNVEFLQADAERLGLPAALADGAFARWVLCFAADPRAIVQGVARALRPGGRFAVLDYSRYLAFTVAPRSEAIERVFLATDRSVRARGGDPDIGCALPAMLRENGLEVVEVAPVVRVARPGSALWKWPETFFATYTHTLVEMQLLTPTEREAFHAAWAERSADPDSFLLTPTMTALVAIKR